MRLSLISLRRARHSARFTRGSAAFTLAEIMIVVGIMMLVAAIGFPAMVRTVNKEGMRKAVSDVIEGCGNARARAIMTGEDVELVIRQDGSISVEAAREKQTEPDGPGPISAKDLFEEPAPRETVPAFSGHLPDDIAVELLDVNFRPHMDQEEARVRFYPNGTSDEFTIVMTGPGGEMRKISLDVITSVPDMEILREAR